MDRRRFLTTAAAGMATAASGTPDALGFLVKKPSRGDRPIDRQSVVQRHNPAFSKFSPFHALSVGNGEFAFTVDATGLQTFDPECAKDFPLCTAAHWAWHTNPLPQNLQGQPLRWHSYDAHGRAVTYPTDKGGQEELFDYQRTNAHKFHLGRISFASGLTKSGNLAPADLHDVRQELDLWTGIIRSKFTYLDKPVEVITCAHPNRDAVAVRITSPLLAAGDLRVRAAFPYASPERGMADWISPQKHTTTMAEAGPRRTVLHRVMDSTEYWATLEFPESTRLTQQSQHEYALATGTGVLEFTCHFSHGAATTPALTVTEAAAASAQHWQEFWSNGGFVDLGGSTDPRADELERRTVLSLYNTALHCSGSLPPAETGLLCNSWYGKFHLEMHWWHGVHFATWNRLPLLERSLGYYASILPAARALAQKQGYQGARWPKMTDRTGQDSPSPVGPLLVWQQPHPIYYAELSYAAHPGRHTLEQWRDVVFETAEFLADYAALDSATGRYVLGPPLKTVSENTDALHAHNPTFELAYWRFGLSTAQQWRRRLGLAPEPRWARVLQGLADLPTSSGLYLLEEGMADTYTRWNWEHPAHLGALGMQPGQGVDTATMRATLRRTMQVWRWDTSWGWDFPMAAMCAARVGEPELAVQALLIDSPKNRYHPNGHNYQTAELTAYLPGNGGLLAAIGMMAKGWQGGPAGAAPGFPKDGKWSVRAEALRTWM